jgi:hypothetical protein
MSEVLKEGLNYKLTEIAVGTLSTELINPNAKRRYLLIQNKSDEAVYLNIGTAAEGTEGIQLSPAGHENSKIEFSSKKGNLTQQPIYAVCSSGDKTLAVVEAFANNESAAPIKEFDISLVNTLISSDLAASDELGISVDVDGDYAVIGAQGNKAAYIFKKSTISSSSSSSSYIQWTQIKKLEEEYTTHYGVSVSIDGDVVVVGDYSADITSGADIKYGAAFIYYKDTGGSDNFGLIKKVWGSESIGDGYFGISVCVRGEYLIAGALNELVGGLIFGVTSGAAYIFKKDEGGADNWGEIKRLINSDPANGDKFGCAVTIDGDYAFVGANQDAITYATQGSVHIFKKDEGGTDNWGLLKRILSGATEIADGKWFGGCLDVDGDNLIVGCALNPYNPVGTIGSFEKAYIFNKDKGGTDNWGLVKEIDDPDPTSTDLFSISVCIKGNYAVVGAMFDDDVGADSGSAFVYYKDKGGPSNWGLVKQLTPSTETAYDYYANSVEIDGDNIIVGSSYNSVGVGYAGAGFIYDYS